MSPIHPSHRRGEIGELMLDSFLDRRGFEVFHNWDKLVTDSGIDRIAYDPKTDKLYLIDNKAINRTINDASALTLQRLGGGNLDELERVLDQHSGFSERARRAFEANRVERVVANAHPDNLNRPFSSQVFARGWKALDVATGGIYSTANEFRAARASFSSGQGGFASVGGMVFALISVGGLVYAISGIRNARDVTDLVISNAVNAGAGYLLGRLAGSASMGAVLLMVVQIKDDHGSPSESDLRESAITDFLNSNELPATDNKLRAEADALLFGTEPNVLWAEPTSDGTRVGDLAMETIHELDGDRNEKILLSQLLAIARLDGDKYVDMLSAKLRPEGGDYASFLRSTLEEELGPKLAGDLLAAVLGGPNSEDGAQGERNSDSEGGSPTNFDMERDAASRTVNMMDEAAVHDAATRAHPEMATDYAPVPANGAPPNAPPSAAPDGPVDGFDLERDAASRTFNMLDDVAGAERTQAMAGPGVQGTPAAQGEAPETRATPTSAGGFVERLLLTATALFDPGSGYQAGTHTPPQTHMPPIVAPPDYPTSLPEHAAQPHHDVNMAPGTPDGYGGYAVDNGDGIADHTVAGPHVGAGGDPHDAAHDPADATHSPHDAAHDPADTTHSPHDAAHDPADTTHSPHDAAHDPSGPTYDPSDPSAAGTQATPDAAGLDHQGNDPSGAQHTITATSHDSSTSAPHDPDGAGSAQNSTGQTGSNQVSGDDGRVQYDPATQAAPEPHEHAGGNAPQYDPSAHRSEHIGPVPEPQVDHQHQHGNEVDGANSHMSY